MRRTKSDRERPRHQIMLEPTFCLDSVHGSDYCSVMYDIGQRVDVVITSEK